MIKVIEQGAYMNRVDKTPDGKITAECSFLGTRYECSVVIYADARGMKTEKVLYAVHRTPQNDNLVQDEISELAGETCTFGASGIIKSLPDYDGNGLIKELLLEDLRGISQAEIYMLEEIGVADPIEYEKIWLDQKVNYCRPYTGRMPGLYDWPHNVNSLNHYRTRNLYNKYKQYTIITEGGDEAVINGTYQDSFHEMHAQISYSMTGRQITGFDMTMQRWPYAACFEMDHTASGLFVGRNIDELTKREIGGMIGGPNGCFHLVDIVADMAKAARDRRELDEIRTKTE